MAFRLQLSLEEHRIYDVWFERVTSQSNKKQALAQFLVLSGLSNQQLAYIWSSSDLNQTDLTEARFQFCMRMVALIQQGYTPTPDVIQSVQSLSMPFFGYEALPVAPDTDPVWEISAQDRDYYVQGFQHLSGGADALPLAQAFPLFARSGLPEAIINKILLVADIGLDNRLDKMQFIVTMHLIKLVRLYKTNVPSKLPSVLISSIQSSRNVVSEIPVSEVNYISVPSSKSDSMQKSLALQVTEQLESSKAKTWRYCKLPFSDTDALHIAKLLFRASHQHVSTLEIGHVELSINGVAAFAKMLAHNTGLTALLLEHVIVPNGGSLSILISSLACNQNIQRLHLNDCNISDTEAMVLCGILNGKNSLREIGLLNNHLSLQAISRLKEKSECFRIHVKLSPNSFDSMQLIPGREPSASKSPSEDKSTLQSVSIIPNVSLSVGKPVIADTTSFYMSSTQAHQSTIEVKIRSICMHSGDLMKTLALKLSFSIVSSHDIPQPSSEDKLYFMRLQVSGRIITCLLTILAIESVRAKLMNELQDLSKRVSELILELDKNLSEFQLAARNLSSMISPDTFIRFKLLHAQYYFHTHRSLFAFYRTLHLILCSLWLNCLLKEQEVTFKIEEEYRYELTANVLKSVKKIASLSSTKPNWIYSVSEEIARRLCFRYECQIRVLDASNSIRFAVAALYRILAILAIDFEVKSLKQTIVYILEQVGSPDIKSKLANKTHLIIQKPSMKWIAESVFTKAAVAAIADGSDCDRWMLDDDKFNLWSGKKSFQPERYGYRICSFSELSKIQSQHHMIQVASPPTSRWLGHHQSTRSERLPFLSQIAFLSSFQHGESEASPMVFGEIQQPQSKSSIRAKFQRMLGRKFSDSNSNPGLNPDDKAGV